MCGWQRTPISRDTMTELFRRVRFCQRAGLFKEEGSLIGKNAAGRDAPERKKPSSDSQKRFCQ